MKKTIKKILAGGLAVVCTVTACVTAITTNGFGIFTPTQTEQTQHNNPFIFGNFFENGITVTANADEASPYEGLVELDYTLYKSQYWNSSNVSRYNVLIGDASNSSNFWATEKFTKETLPVGSKIVIASGWQYRPEGWINDAANSIDARPIVCTTSVVDVTEAWWGNWTTRAFNISKTDSSDLSSCSESDICAVFKIYVPSNTTPSTPSSDDSVKGFATYPYTMQKGYYDSNTGALVQSNDYFCTNWIDRTVGAQSADFQLKVDIKSGYRWTLLVENKDGSYDSSGLVDHQKSESLPGNIFNSSTTRFVIIVSRTESNSADTLLTLEEAQEALTMSVPYRHSYTLKATVNVDATDKSVTWSVAWADGSTENVNDYVFLEPTGTDGLTAVVYNIQPFEKQVVVKVTSNSNPEVSAQCTIDYVKRLKSIDPFFGSDGTTIALTSADGAPTSVFIQNTYSKGTLDGTLESSMKFTLTDEFIEALQGASDYISACKAESLTLPVSNGKITLTSSQTVFTFTIANVFACYTESVSGVLLNNAIHKTANEFEAAGKTIGTVEITATYTHSSGYAQNYSKTINITAIDSTEQAREVTSIALNNSTLVF